MQLTVHYIDAFSTRIFGGNPAAVVPLERWPDEVLMQSMAAEHNLAETAFFAGKAGHYRLRWFAPLAEVDFCGHATLASAWVIFEELEPGLDRVRFETRAGELQVRRTGDGLLMDLPAREHTPCVGPERLSEALGLTPRQVLEGEDIIAVLDNEAQVAGAEPDAALLKKLPGRALVITAPGDSVDFVSRVFGPKIGIEEDPVTGSAHCALAPYWARQFGRNRLVARQLSRRGGELICEQVGDRVHITGQCVKYMVGYVRTGG